MGEGVYRNSTEVTNLHGVPMYVNDIADACLTGRLNLFLQGDTGSGKTQLARDKMNYFGDKSMFILGRNDMDTRELFQQINLEKLRTGSSSEELRELTDKVDYHLIVVDELPNCVPAVRAQLFNLFDGFIEINGKPYEIGKGYSVGIATGNVGQQFTESSNELGRALRDRMHVIVDTDYFAPTAADTLEILAKNTNPRVAFEGETDDTSNKIIESYQELAEKPIPLEKLIVANYLLHGLDYCEKGSKKKMKTNWPTQLESHEQGSDVGLVLPISPRAAKSIIRLSQALDGIALQRGASPELVESGALGSMMQAYKLASAYSGVLNEADVSNNYGNDHYKAMDAVIATTTQQFVDKKDAIAAGIEMAREGKRDQKVMDLFPERSRWSFMRSTLDGLVKSQEKKKEESGGN
jgi:MoxR-like ATPase